jgi:tRNA G10  N-methylase Trm11
MEHQEAQKIERWLVGEYRRGDDRVVHELVWQVDDEPRLARSPHARYFKMRIGGTVEETRANRQRRRLSACDATVMVHLARAEPGDLVIDPFAGIGGIVQEARLLGLDMLCGDIDASLAPGLREVSGGLAAIWNAAKLPLPDHCADAVVTEPPYSDEMQEDVLRSMREIARILRPEAPAVVLIDREMLDDVLRAVEAASLSVEADYLVYRASGMRARLLVMELDS